jgi:tetratricopeptide (TPR) repeat protein
MRRMHWLVVTLVTLGALGGLEARHPAAVRADGGPSDTPRRSATGQPEDPDYDGAVRAIKANDFAAAIRMLQGVVARDGTNADAYNWLGYATRKNGDAAGSIPIYEKALAINPKHRGAHEYIGEAYLTLNDLPKAKEHLARLNSLCFFPCEEYSDLKRAVEAYEKRRDTGKPSAAR